MPSVRLETRKVDSFSKTKQFKMQFLQALLEDAREFLASEAWYTERGIPYRRGYLLHGVPGGGWVTQVAGGTFW